MIDAHESIHVVFIACENDDEFSHEFRFRQKIHKLVCGFSAEISLAQSVCFVNEEYPS